jgi:hypothetical protein
MKDSTAPSVVEEAVGTASSIGLPARLIHRPLTGLPVDGERGPTGAVLVAQVDEQGVSVVLDAQAVPGIGLLMQSSYGFPRCGVLGNERRPALPARVRAGALVAG